MLGCHGNAKLLQKFLKAYSLFLYLSCLEPVTDTSRTGPVPRTCYSKHSLWASGMGMSWELVRNAGTQALPQTSESKSASWRAPQVTCVLTKFEKHSSQGYCRFYYMPPKWPGHSSGRCCHWYFMEINAIPVIVTFPPPVLKGAMQCHLPLLLLLSVSVKYLFPVQP